MILKIELSREVTASFNSMSPVNLIRSLSESAEKERGNFMYFNQ